MLAFLVSVELDITLATATVAATATLARFFCGRPWRRAVSGQDVRSALGAEITVA